MAQMVAVVAAMVTSVLLRLLLVQDVHGLLLAGVVDDVDVEVVDVVVPFLVLLLPPPLLLRPHLPPAVRRAALIGRRLAAEMVVAPSSESLSSSSFDHDHVAPPEAISRLTARAKQLSLNCIFYDAEFLVRWGRAHKIRRILK